MAKGLRRFFAQAKKTVPTRVGDKLVELTATQAVRLDELSTLRPRAGARAHCSLADAAATTGRSEDELLFEAAAGRLTLYVDASGLPGRLFCRRPDGEVLQSAVQRLASGYFALLPADARSILDKGAAAVSVLAFEKPADVGALALPEGVLAAFDSWRDGTRAFRLETPLGVDRQRLVMLPPLPGVR